MAKTKTAKAKAKRTPNKKTNAKTATAKKATARTTAKTTAKTAKKTSVPAAIAALLTAHAGRKKPLHYHAAVSGFAGDLEVTLGAKAAAARLADDEAELGAQILPIGFFSGLPLMVDTGKKALPVTVMMDGMPWPVAASFAAFAKHLGEPKPPVAGPKKGDKLLEPVTVKGYALPWPEDGYAQLIEWPSTNSEERYPELKNRNPFLWIELKGKNRDLYYSDIRLGQSVAKKWETRTEKYHRGTGEFLDVAWYPGDRSMGGSGLPLVSPRVRAMLETLPLKDVEFLPHRVSIKGKKADYFIVHPTHRVTLYPSGTKTTKPTWISFANTNVPADLHLFRLTELPEVIIASSTLVDLLRPHELSGADFLPIAKWQPRQLIR